MQKTVNKIAYPVSRFEASASESNGVVYFDSTSQSYRLAALSEGQTSMDGDFLKGNLADPSSPEISRGEVVQY